MLFQLNSFLKKKDGWIERYVDLSDPKKAEFKEEKIDIKKIEKHLNFEISRNQIVIEYSPDTFKNIKTIYLTASGGPFLNKKNSSIANIKPSNDRCNKNYKNYKNKFYKV